MYIFYTVIFFLMALFSQFALHFLPVADHSWAFLELKQLVS